MKSYSQHLNIKIDAKPRKISHLIFSNRNTSPCCDLPPQFRCAGCAPGDLNGGPPCFFASLPRLPAVAGLLASSPRLLPFSASVPNPRVTSHQSRVTVVSGFPRHSSPVTGHCFSNRDTLAISENMVMERCLRIALAKHLSGCGPPSSSRRRSGHLPKSSCSNFASISGPLVGKEVLWCLHA
jgi:hypothetical protein